MTSIGLFNDLTPDQLAARTPAEAKRHWMIDRLWLICLFCCAVLMLLIGIIWLGDWPTALAAARLNLLGWVAGGILAVLTIIVWTFSLGGPVGRWVARWGNRQLSGEDDETAAQHAYDGGAQ